MKTVRHYASARDKLLHVEVDGCIVNITVGLSDMQGRRVTSVSIVPDDESRGGDGEGRVWRYVPGESNHRLIRLLEDEKDLPADNNPARPVDTCGCGHPLIWVGGHWEHDAAPYLWGDDHDPDAAKPEGPLREHWDQADGVIDEEDQR